MVRPADQHVGLAGGEGRVEPRDRGIGVNVELEAVLGVDATRLHDVPDQRLNTGSVRLETLMMGFCCAGAAEKMLVAAMANAARDAVSPRRNSFDMTLPPE